MPAHVAACRTPGIVHDERVDVGLALCSATSALPGEGNVVALCLALPPGELPEWIDLVPAGELVRGRDGREFRNPDAGAVVKAHDAEIPVDEGHESEKPWMPGPAVGWISEMRKADGGAIQGRVAWNSVGATLVKDRRYRWISPAILHDRDGRILKIVSAALTNRPNLRMSALNQLELPMDPRLLALLQIAATSTADHVLAAVAALHTAHANAAKEVVALQARVATPDPAQWVPKAVHDTVLGNNAQMGAKVAELEARAAAGEGEALITEALKAGKVTPAQVEYHRAAMKAPGGVAAFKAWAAIAPPVIAPGSQVPPGSPPGANGGALTAEQLAVCSRLGMRPEDYQLALNNMGAYEQRLSATARPAGQFGPGASAPGATPPAK